MTPTNTSPHNSVFDTVKNQPELRNWLMRAYFNPQKHSEEPYFDPDITKDTVLSYISDRTNKFPQTPENVVSLWNILPSLREGLRSFPADEAVKDESVNTKGNETLATIGKAIGGVTPAMVNKISETATTKLGAMLRALNSDNAWLAKEAYDKIEDAFLTVAEAYTDAVRESQTAQEIVDRLIMTGTLLAGESSFVDQIESQGLEDIIEYHKSGATQAEIESVFLEDLNKPVSVFFSMQLPISRSVFPPPKRGRPKKQA